MPALVGDFQAETAPVFDEKAWMFCPLIYADEVKPSLWPRHAQMLRQMDLQAQVQEKNLRTVLAAVDILKENDAFALLRNDAAVTDGILHTARNMHFHGRWERLSTQPFVIADIGHNAHALQHNFRQLQEMLAGGLCSSLIIVYGIMADKDLDAILPLMPENATYIFTSPDTPRALPADEILRRFNACRAPQKARACAIPSVREAVQKAWQLARDAEAPLIYIGGSTFVVAEALPLFK